MKILLLTGAIKAENSKRKYFTGLDLVVTQIGAALCSNNEINYFTTSPIGSHSRTKFGKVFSYDNHELLKYLPSSLKVNEYKFFRSDCSLKENIKNFRSILIAEYFAEILDKIKPDIVHINGITYGNLLCALKALQANIPVAYTLHGLSYTADDCTDFQKKIERTFISSIVQHHMMISVVSSGVKQIIEQDFGASSNIIITPNALDILPCKLDKTLLRNKYNIPSDAYVLISVGSIGERKNQMQVARVVRILNEQGKNIFAIFAGQDKTRGLFEKNIKKANQTIPSLITGFVSKQTLAELYTCSDANIVTSKSEGFGLSIIEAGAYGLPTILFKDLDAFSDVVFYGGFQVVENRSDSLLGEKIIECMNTRWDREKIRERVLERNPDLNTQYLNFYKMALNANNSDILIDLKNMVGN